MSATAVRAVRRRSRVMPLAGFFALVLLAALGCALLVNSSARAAAPVYGKWTPSNAGTVATYGLNDVSFAPDGLTGIAVGDSGTISRTTDGGVTWGPISSNTSNNLNGVHMVTATVGYVAGSGGSILKTTNGGLNWSSIGPDLTNWESVYFADANNGWIVGRQGLIGQLRYTNNGGSSWTNANKQDSIADFLYSVDMFENLSIAVGFYTWTITSRAEFYSSATATTYAADWNFLFESSGLAARDVNVQDATTAWAVGDSGRTWRTKNGGQGTVGATAWPSLASGTTSNLNGVRIYRPAADHVWAVGAGGLIRRTRNSTAAVPTWATEASGTTQTLNDITITGDKAWAVGANRTLISYGIELVPPVTTATGVEATTGVWVNTNQTITLTATDPGPAASGVAATYYTIDGGGTQTYSASTPPVVSTEGQHTITYWSVDAGGNVEAVNTGYVYLDKTAPTVTATAPSGWQNKDVTVTLTPTDPTPGSGVAKTQYRLTPSGTWTDATSNQFTVPAPADGSNNGTHVYEFRAIDAAGNVSTVSTSTTVTVNIDTTAPTLTSDAPTTWQNSDVTVTLAGTDTGGSGIDTASYQYRVKDATTWTDGKTITATATTTYEAIVKDRAGNTSATYEFTVNIDTTAPTTSSDLSLNATSGWLNSAKTVSLSASDDPTPGAGMGATYYTINGGPEETYLASFVISDEGSTKITYWSVDALGNAETPVVGYVNIDRTAPTVVHDGDSLYHNQDVTISLADSYDQMGGSGVVKTQYRLTPDGAWTDATGNAFVVSAPADGLNDGTHTYEVQAIDAAGNTSPSETLTVKIDATKPTVDATGLSADWLVTTPREVSFTATDTDGSGVKAIYYTQNGGAAVLYDGTPLSIDTVGETTFTYWSIDNGGNKSAVGTGYVRISDAGATVSGLSGTNDENWHTSTPVPVTITASGGVEPVQVYYKIGDTEYSPSVGSVTFDVTSEGSNLITYWTVDDNGAESAHETGYVNIDTVKPTVSAEAPAGWQNKDVTVTLTPADPTPGSGVAKTQYRLTPDGTWTDATGNQFTVPALADGSNDGTHTYEVRTVDVAGNEGSPETVTVKIDTTAPTTTSDLSLNATSGWLNSAKTVSLSASDDPTPGAGMGATYYTINGGPEETYLASFVISDEGSTKITYWSVDALGNAETPVVRYVNIDTTAPTVSAEAPTTWQNADVTVELGGNDATSGVAELQYRLKGSEDWLTATGGSFTVSAPADGTNDGTHVYEVRSLDKATLISETTLVTVKIDATKPTVTAEGLADAWSVTTPREVSFTANGEVSGIDKLYYKVGSNDAAIYDPDNKPTFTTAGEYSITYWAVDNAGNTSTVGSGYVRISDTAPSTSDLSSDATSDWHTTDPVPVTIDATGGTDPTKIYYTIDGGEPVGPVDAPASFEVSGDGSHEIVYWTVDDNGAESAHETGYVNIDTTAPTVSAEAPTTWQNADVTVELGGNDATSGVAELQYRLKGSEDWLTATDGSFTVSAPADGSNDGTHVYEVRVIDGAGIASDIQMATVMIDAAAPVTKATGLDPIASGWSTSAPVVTLKATDKGSGVEATYYLLDGDTTPRTYTGPFTIDQVGPHSVVYWSVDKVGNVESQHSAAVNVDNVPGTIQRQVTVDPESRAVTLSFTAFDNESGVAAIQYRRSGAAEWTSVAATTAQFTVSAANDGELHEYAYEYRVLDVAGNVSKTMTYVAQIDWRTPTTTITGLPTRIWVKYPVTLQLDATPGSGGLVVRTEYKIDDNEWQVGRIIGPENFPEGAHRVLYKSTDAKGNVEPEREVWVRYDVHGPRTYAYAARGYKRKNIALRYKVTDNLSPKAITLRVEVKNSRGKVMKRFSIAERDMGTVYSVNWKPTAAVTYRYYVYARDMATNDQAIRGYAKVVVK